MMFYKLLNIFLLSLIALCAKAQNQHKNLGIEPAPPKAGKVVQFTYNPSGTPLASSQTIHAIAKIHEKHKKDFIMTARDVTLYGGGDQWKGAFSLPDSCVSFFLVIKDNLGTIDANNGEGYMFALEDAQGNALSGGKASLAYRFVETYSPYGISYNQERASRLIKEEFQRHPALKPVFFSTYIKTINFTDTSAKRKLAREADLIFQNYKEHGAETLDLLSSLYKKLGQRKKSEKCMELILQEFPESRIAFQRRTLPYQEAFFKAETLEERLKIHHEMVQVMEEHMNPNSDPLNTSLDNELKTTSLEEKFSRTLLENEKYSLTIQNLQLSKLLRENYWKNGDLSAWFELLDSSKYYFSKQYLYNAFAKKCLVQDTLLEKAYEIATRAVSMTRQHLNAPRTIREQSFTHFADSEIQMSRKKTLVKNLTTQASILHQQNKTEEALDAYREAVEISDRLNPEINEQFATFLIDVKMFGEAREEIQQAMRIGKHTLEMEQMLDELSNDQNLSEADDSIGSDELTKEYLASKRATIAATLQNTPAPDFELVSLEGDTVQLSKLRGKVVVLDFWASWCMPCIASFPGMQKAVEKYENDSSVVFLFVNLDGKEAKDKSRKNIEEKGYGFNVLLDSKNQTGPAYSIHGIPVKFVIDQEGVIRFRKGSFEPNTKDEVEELSIMIDLAMKRKSG